MDDQDVERLLRRYQPVAPPPELRTRIMRPSPRLWPWAAAASALLAASIALHELTARTIVRTDVGPRPDASRLAIEQLTDMLGGDDAARRIAEDVVERARIERERAPATLSANYDEAR